MKKVLSIILSLIIVASFCVVALAENTYSAFDYYSALTDEEKEELNSLGNALVENYDFAAILSLYTSETLDDINARADEDFYADNCGCTDGVILVLDSEYYFVRAYGEYESILDDDEVYNAFCSGDTLYDCAYSFMSFVADCVYNYNENPTATVTPKSTTLLTDNADILSDAEEIEVNSRLEEIRAATGFETAILTVNDPACTEGTIYRYASDYYNSNFSGNGAVLVMCMYERDWKYIFMGNADYKGNYSDEWITDTVVQYLSSGNYKKAFLTFADITNDVYTGKENSKQYREFDWSKGLLISLIIGFVLAFIITSKYKNELKTVHMADDANVYTKPGSLNIIQSRDYFLYRNVTRTAKPKNNSSGGSRSSGGGSHSGGGKF